MGKLLIIEDNKDVNSMLAEMLASEGYETSSAFTGIEGLKMAQEDIYDLILLDIMLPYKSGDEVLKEVRAFSEVPVIIISAKDMIGTKIDLLKLGADDYITKPFDLGEVAARVETNIRRVKKQENSIQKLTYKDIEMDTNLKEVLIQGNVVELTTKEYQILELLLKNKNKVFSKSNIYESIWQEEYLGDDNAVKAHMSNLRSKLKKYGENENYIETVWGMGYRLHKE